jgi:WhiB family redox-sensing transcriptional regulator
VPGERIDFDYPDFPEAPPCTFEDPELFFPHSSSYAQIPRAVAVCERCPFRRPCLAYALTHDVHGIWGGLTGEQRKELRREHGIHALPLISSDVEIVQGRIDLADRGGASAAQIALALRVTPRTVQRQRSRRRADHD